MDHQGQCLHFGEAGLEGDTSMRHQLQTLAASLVKVTKQQQQAQAQQQQAEVQATREAQRLAFFKKVGRAGVVWVWVWVWMCGCIRTRIHVGGWCGVLVVLVVVVWMRGYLHTKHTSSLPLNKHDPIQKNNRCSRTLRRSTSQPWRARTRWVLGWLGCVCVGGCWEGGCGWIDIERQVGG